MASFADLFQRAVKSDSLIEMPIDSLIEASANASTAQYELNPKKTEAIIKSLAKGEPLLLAPMIASYMGVDHAAGGRHRIYSADFICKNYGINAKGKPELKTDANSGSLLDIERTMLVDAVTVDSLATLAALILASNDSRVMTAPEKASVKLEGGKATAADRFKLRFSPFLAANLDLSDSEGNAINVSPVTLAQICTKLKSGVTIEDGVKVSYGIKNIESATDEQLNDIASHLNDFLNERELPVKFAQFHGEHIIAFLSNPVELFDEEGNAIESFDKDGDLTEVLYHNYMNAQIKVEPKVTKATKTPGATAERMRKMQEALDAAGITI